MKALERKGVVCDIALDESAPGILFEKNGYSWYKISVPSAGGHSATKLSAIKGAFKLITATFKARSAIKKSGADFVVGVLGGGAIVGSLGAKFARKPGFSLISTPLDSMVCPKFNQSYVLPELDKFRWENLPENMDKAFYPLDENVGDGDESIALSKLKEYPNFDENKKTIVFSSGSSIFKGMLDAINLVSNHTDEYNLVLVGLPLHEEYMEEIDDEKIIYAGFIDWINHLFKFADLTVLTDDGVSLEEALTCEKPIIALTKVKWGRYQNMAGVFKGAILESEVSDVCQSIDEAFENYDSLRENALVYGRQCAQAADYLAEDMLKRLE
ncbi:glycosyltransferase family 1 protein [Methanobrevibacter sp.]|uniref:glycosyltransferase family 1 protein n=1 Tax=Methanobrevibacter sp. TaxID=66852 RepID=UPI00386FCBCB